ncbi:phosphate ABC transporter substrate-binding protein PstS [Nocardioides sp. Kera G14]|uniref:phosphate ABC transporter substrate-binding protein PstS n=1 Tax=Nocardioides sp. Kera G14 TaxID=2884264 RepID=UPI001D12F46D|nr:phosphate ABC transporter substrate-binding protein PstS [Nocardioides sp. Kera G14]UDY23145.1 phosphate ABC transporter substrate-binding protein PstS [Nocardioides sp. Kera G14]
MTTTSLRRVLIPGVAALAAVASLAACGSSDGDSAGDSGSGSSGLSGTVAAGGSSAQEKAQEAWRAGFGADNPDVTITYDPVGSGTGRDNFYSGAYKFAGSDSAIPDEDMSKATAACGGSDPIEVPVFVSPIDIAFNLTGISTLNLDASTIAKIFAGQIKTWNDPAITALNPDAKLPATAISPVHRSDSSGTTDNFTDYLFKASGGAWKTEHSSDWPVQTGEAAEGTSGVVGAIQDGEGTIGYADDSAVASTKLGKVSVKVGDSFVAPSADGAAAGLAASTVVDGADSQLVYDIKRDGTDASVYPVFLVSYLIACPTYDDKATADIVKGFGEFVVSETGQKAAAANALSAPLPSDVADKANAILEKIAAK